MHWESALGHDLVSGPDDLDEDVKELVDKGLGRKSRRQIGREERLKLRLGVLAKLRLLLEQGGKL